MMQPSLISSLYAVLVVLSFGGGWFMHEQKIRSDAQKPPELHEVYEERSTFENIVAKKSLNVVLLNSPSTYYIGSDGPQGYEYDLLKNYADSIGVDLNITTAHTVKEALELSKKLNIHIVSAAIAKTKKRETELNFGPSYFEVQEQVICNRDMLQSGAFPKDVEGLAGLRISVGEDTSYSDTIKELQSEGYDINATFVDGYSTEDLLEQVAKREIDCTIADSNIYALNLRYFTELALAFTISGREQLAWVLAPDTPKLEASMYEWLNVYNQSGAMAQLKDHYYSYVFYFDYYNTTTLYSRIKTRLVKYESYFKEASKEHAIPWTLIAAISYQESHWNPKAKSFTGVKGLMMLTRHTAKLLGIKNRLDPRASIMGGTQHLVNLMKIVPEDVVGEERLKFALATYNIGFGHILDARALARKMSLNPSIWSDLKKTLPLLSQKSYYRNLKYGYARGSEPVRYVDSIYNFKDILEKSLANGKNFMRE